MPKTSDFSRFGASPNQTYKPDNNFGVSFQFCSIAGEWISRLAGYISEFKTLVTFLEFTLSGHGHNLQIFIDQFAGKSSPMRDAHAL
jgi:hypothetical protein